MHEGVTSRMASGAAWMVLFKLIERSIGLVSTLFLVRLLQPADFGTVAMAVSFIAMAELLAAFGFDIALIHNQSAGESQYHTAWTCNALLGLTIGALMVSAAAPVAAFYHHSELFWVVVALSFGPVLSGLENIGVVAFRKEFEFRKEFFFQLAKKLISFAVVVPLAYLLRSYWALVIGMLATKAASTALSFAVHPFRPRFSLAGARSLFHFSKWLLFNNALAFLKERSSDFIIGRLHGPGALGHYNVSYEIANLPTTELSAPINRALIPGYARLAAAPERVAAAFLRANEALAMVALPAAALLFVLSPLFVPVVLGQRWLAAVPLIQLLALNGAVLVFQSQTTAALVAIGQPSAVTKINVGYVLVLVPAIAWQTNQYGALGAAQAVLTLTVLFSPAYIYWLLRQIPMPLKLLALSVARPALGAAALVFTVRPWVPDGAATQSFAGALPWLLALGALGVAVYTLSVALLWLAFGRPPGAEQWMLQRAAAVLRSGRADGGAPLEGSAPRPKGRD